MKRSDFILPEGFHWGDSVRKPFVISPVEREKPFEFDGRVSLDDGIVPCGYYTLNNIVFEGVLGGPSRPIGYVEEGVGYFQNGGRIGIVKLLR
ncbi:hypothetical protein ACFL0X_02650 [Nanoarchaeota archaeon]